MSSTIIVTYKNDVVNVYEADSYERGMDGLLRIETSNRQEIGSRQTFFIPTCNVWSIEVKR